MNTLVDDIIDSFDEEDDNGTDLVLAASPASDLQLEDEERFEVRMNEIKSKFGFHFLDEEPKMEDAKTSLSKWWTN